MTVTRTQITTVFSNSTGLTTLATAAYSQPAGDTITVRVACEADAAGAITMTVTDTAGNSYTARNQGTDAGNLQKVQIFDVINCAGNASNVITATKTAGGTVQKFVICADRWTPTGTITFGAQPAAATGVGTSGTTAAFAQANFSVCAAKKWVLAAVTPGGGWTVNYDGTTDGDEVFAMYRIDPSPIGSEVANATAFGGSNTWTMTAATYTETIKAPSAWFKA